MESNSLHRQPSDNASDVTWTRLLAILNANSQPPHRTASGTPTFGAHAEAALDYPSSPSATWSSPSQPASMNERPGPDFNDSFATSAGASASSQQHQPQQPQLRLLQQPLIHHPPPHLLYHHQQQHRQSQSLSLSVSDPDSSHSRGLLLFGQLTRRAQAAAAASEANAAAGTAALHPDSGSVSESAERHRLVSESAGVSVQAFVEWVADLLPFLLLLAWVFVFNHAGALLLILVLTACTLNANADIRKLIALRREVLLASCVAQSFAVAAFTFAAVVATLPDTSVLRVLTLRPIRAPNAVDTLLLVLLADSILRFGSLAAKLLVVAWFRSRPVGAAAGAGLGGGGHLSGARLQRQQSRVLTAVERGVVLYRTVLPGPVWYGYLLHGGGFSPVVASLFCGFYLVLKLSYVAAQTRLFMLALKTAARRGALYGTYVGRTDGGEEGTFGACPVCQDPVNTPVRLDCGHIFCDECILEWLERDRTCPMCRAQVRPTSLPSCSDGTSPLLPQVF